MLGTREAARFLGVSEASIRRWSDAGDLPAHRIGRRRSRRFAEADLARFRDSGHSAHGNRGETLSELAVGAHRFPLHSHLATFYETDAARLRLTLPFLRDGLQAGEPCFLVAKGAMRDLYVDALGGEDGELVERAVAEERFVVLPGIGPGLKDALDVWEHEFWQATSRGAQVVRVIGEMTSEREVFESDEEMIRYEFALNALTQRFPCVVLCQYDVRAFSGTTILGALKAHPDLLTSRVGEVIL